MKTIALLPMKGNSERIPGKNFKMLAGKPLFRWVLDTLNSISSIDSIVINTDARGLLEQHGLFETERIKIRDRRSDICGDEVSMNVILQDDLAATDADAYLMTHTTNPLISKQTLETAISCFKYGKISNKHDSLFGVTKFQTRFYKQDGTAINHDPQNLLPTQNLEPWYEENSCVYLFDKKSFSKTNARIGLTPSLFEIPKLEAIDIDEPEDWALASALAENKYHETNNA